MKNSAEQITKDETQGFNWSVIRDIFFESEQEIKNECAFQDYATPIIQNKFKLPFFNFSFAHLANSEIKSCISALKKDFNNK